MNKEKDSSPVDQATRHDWIALSWPFQTYSQYTYHKTGSQTPLTNVVSTISLFKIGSSSLSPNRSSPYFRNVARVTRRKKLVLGMDLLATTCISTSTPRKLISCNGERTIRYWPESPWHITGMDVMFRPNDSRVLIFG